MVCDVGGCAGMGQVHLKLAYIIAPDKPSKKRDSRFIEFINLFSRFGNAQAKIVMPHREMEISSRAPASSPVWFRCAT